MNTHGYIYTPRYGSYARDRIYLTEYTLERRIDELRDTLSVKKPDVFVSHKNEDKNTAEESSEKRLRSAD